MTPMFCLCTLLPSCTLVVLRHAMIRAKLGVTIATLKGKWHGIFAAPYPTFLTFYLFEYILLTTACTMGLERLHRITIMSATTTIASDIQINAITVCSVFCCCAAVAVAVAVIAASVSAIVIAVAATALVFP